MSTLNSFQQNEEELAIWLGLQSLSGSGSGFGPKRLLRLLERFGDVREAWVAKREQLVREMHLAPDFADAFIAKREKVDPEKLLAKLNKSGARAIPFNDPFYPILLREIHDPPTVLFVSGDLRETDFNHVISVVGTRRPTSYGQKVAKDIARGLASNGVVVGSGMALGIDSLAHWGAIEGGGRTIAVVATGPDVCYPSSNKKLYQSIVEGHGIVISEYFPGTNPEKWHFPARNRIISGIAKAIVVVEAGESSGALITARLAFEQSRDVFAVPGRVDSPMSAGTNALIRKPSAQIIRNHEDVLDSLNWVKTDITETTTVVELFGREKEIYQVLSNEPIHFDVLSEQTGIPVGELSASLTMLELAGLISRFPGDWYSKRDSNAVMSQQELR